MHKEAVFPSKHDTGIPQVIILPSFLLSLHISGTFMQCIFLFAPCLQFTLGIKLQLPEYSIASKRGRLGLQFTAITVWTISHSQDY